MTSFHSRVKSSKIQVVKQGEGCSPESTPRLNRWLPTPAGGTARYRHQPNRTKHTRAGFRGFNPNESGGNSVPGAFKFGGCRAAKAEGAAAARRSSPEGSALDPRASRSRTPRHGPRASGAEGGPLAPPRRLLRLVAEQQPRPRERLPARLGPAGARRVDESGPRPTPLGPGRAHRTGWAGPLDGPKPCLVPGPLRPSLTVSATPAAGRGGMGPVLGSGRSVSPAFPGGSARALTSESRRS